jgi:hypothetical protein
MSGTGKPVQLQAKYPLPVAQCPLDEPEMNTLHRIAFTWINNREISASASVHRRNEKINFTHLWNPKKQPKV